MALRECAAHAAGTDRLGAAYACRDLPGILAARLRRAGIQPLRQTAIPMLSTSFNPANFSYWVAQVIRPFVVNRQVITAAEAAEWFDEFPKLEANGAYFFCITPVLTEGVKVSDRTRAPPSRRRLSSGTC